MRKQVSITEGKNWKNSNLSSYPGIQLTQTAVHLESATMLTLKCQLQRQSKRKITSASIFAIRGGRPPKYSTTISSQAQARPTCDHTQPGVEVASYFLFCPIQSIGFWIVEGGFDLCPGYG